MDSRIQHPREHRVEPLTVLWEPFADHDSEETLLHAFEMIFSDEVIHSEHLTKSDQSRIKK
jgi:hypothetical protein